MRRIAAMGFRIAVAVALCAALAVSRAGAFEQQEFRANDGTAYQVLRAVPPLGGGADHERITTIAGAPGGVGACNQTTMVAAAIAGALPPMQILHPFAAIQRTAILVPNAIGALTFDPTGAGRVTLGSGGSATLVCRNPANCNGGGAALSGLGTASGGVPAACVASGIVADCDNNPRQTIGFGLMASGNPPACQASPTVNTAPCAAEPADGFTLAPGEAIVFVYNGSLAGVGFGIGAGGFGVDGDATGSSCMSGGVVSAMAGSQSVPGPFQPPPGRVRAPALAPVALGALAALLALGGAARLRRR